MNTPPNPIKSINIRLGVAARRRQLREQLGLTPQQLAARILVTPQLHVSAETLTDWENAAYWPMPDVSEKWRQALRNAQRRRRR